MKIYLKDIIYVFFVFALITGFSSKTAITDDVIDPIRIYSENPFYWEYKGEPVLLLGGSRQDNLFNHPEGLAEHLDLLESVGGNYIRNTMSSRDRGNLWAFKQIDDGLYDLDQWHDEYWNRFENLLRLSHERNIIVQVEVWDPWDFFSSQWKSHPFNPGLNINYSAEETGLEEVVDYTNHSPFRHKFFQTPPLLADIPAVRKYQESFVEKMLSVSLKYPNVLYNIRNECRESAEWARYWARFIRDHAEQAGKEVFITDMRRPEDFSTPEQMDLLQDRVHFDFVEISQNSHNKGQHHYDQVIEIRRLLEGNPVPMNNVKIYGGTSGFTGGIEEGTCRFWRNIFGGCGSSRFHRPGSSPFFYGAGLSDLAQTHIRSMRMFTDEIDIFKTSPSNHLLNDRVPNEAYCLAEEGRQYAIYFPDGGEVMMDFTEIEGELEIRWMNIVQSAWLETKSIKGNQQVMIVAPGKGQWAALIKPKIK